jgi:hypothetical protein
MILLFHPSAVNFLGNTLCGLVSREARASEFAMLEANVTKKHNSLDYGT